MFKIGTAVTANGFKSLDNRVGIINNIMGNLYSVNFGSVNRLMAEKELTKYRGVSATVVPLRNVA